MAENGENEPPERPAAEGDGTRASDGDRAKVIEPDRVEDLPQVDDLEEIPRLPRPPLRKLISWNDIFRIALLATFLVAVLVLRKPCANGAANFMRSFEAPPDAGVSAARPDAGLKLIKVTGEESEEELRKKLGRPKKSEPSGPPGPAGTEPRPH